MSEDRTYIDGDFLFCNILFNPNESDVTPDNEDDFYFDKSAIDLNTIIGFWKITDKQRTRILTDFDEQYTINVDFDFFKSLFLHWKKRPVKLYNTN